MKLWQKILIPTLITLAIGSAYLLVVWRQRQDPGVIGQADPGQTLNRDERVVLRALFPAHFEDTLQLQGTTVWMKNGYTIPYFAYTGGKVNFAKRIGLVPSGQRMEVKKIVKQAVPANVDDGVGHGNRQALAVFALPGGSDVYAVPIGAMEGNEEVYYCDLLFYYDDPHGIYDYWPKDAWAAIDAHRVHPGMSEVQTRLAVGQKMHPDGNSEGNRTVVYDQDGKRWTVTFVDNRAAGVRMEPAAR
jgi:hypothetical protein